MTPMRPDGPGEALIAAILGDLDDRYAAYGGLDDDATRRHRTDGDRREDVG